ncbi:MAG: DUF1295 domain-containing protein [Bacteroidia bacterium]|nr:DUF1295 domain-containing protein [Bacteroidia bacterium]
MPYKVKSFLWIVLAYSLAALVAWGTGEYFKELHPLWVIALADVAATLVIFIFSIFFRNASFYDAYWSVAPIAIAGYYLLDASADPRYFRAVLAFLLVLAWGLRLTWNWARGWDGLEHEDWRYKDLRAKTGKWYPLVNFAGIHFFPTVMVYLGCLPLYVSMYKGVAPFSTMDIIAVFITTAGILIEATADSQLRRFRRTKPAPEKILKSGIWSYSRHPNYFGEMTFWLGIFMLGLAADSSSWVMGIGVLVIVLMFIFISIPLIEKRMLARRPGYPAHRKKVSAVIPWKFNS